MVPETRRAHHRSSPETSAQLQRLIRSMNISPTNNAPRKIKEKQLFIEENFRDMLVIIRTQEQTLARFHCNPTLAEAVLMARSHCEKYHPNVPVLEYIVQ